MTAVIETIIFCDGKDNICKGTSFANGDLRHLSANQQRKAYSQNTDAEGSWINIGKKDYCPKCALKVNTIGRRRRTSLSRSNSR